LIHFGSQTLKMNEHNLFNLSMLNFIHVSDTFFRWY